MGLIRGTEDLGWVADVVMDTSYPLGTKHCIEYHSIFAHLFPRWSLTSPFVLPGFVQLLCDSLPLPPRLLEVISQVKAVSVYPCITARHLRDLRHHSVRVVDALYCCGHERNGHEANTRGHSRWNWRRSTYQNRNGDCSPLCNCSVIRNTWDNYAN